jgi:histidinol-phosphate aminotransferase
MAKNPYVEKKSLRLYEEEFSPEAIVSKYGVDPGSIIDFSLNVNPFGPPSSSEEAARKVLSNCGNYPDLSLSALRKCVAKHHEVSGDMLLFGAGLDDVLKLIVQAWSTPGDNIVIHVPTFPRYELEAELHGLKPILVHSESPWAVDIESLRNALLKNSVAISFICSPNNPTGAKISVEDIEALSTEFLSTIFVVDEALIDPKENGAMSLAKKTKNVAVLRTFSKYLGLAGYRVGYAVADSDLISSLEVARPPFNVSLVSAAAALAVINDHEFLKETRTIFDEEREYLTSSLDAIDGCKVRGAYSNMILLELLTIESKNFCDSLAKKGLIVADGKSFKGLESHNSVRISIKDHNKNALLIKSIRDLFDLIGTHDHQ